MADRKVIDWLVQCEVFDVEVKPRNADELLEALKNGQRLLNLLNVLLPGSVNSTFLSWKFSRSTESEHFAATNIRKFQQLLREAFSVTKCFEAKHLHSWGSYGWEEWLSIFKTLARLSQSRPALKCHLRPKAFYLDDEEVAEYVNTATSSGIPARSRRSRRRPPAVIEDENEEAQMRRIQENMGRNYGVEEGEVDEADEEGNESDGSDIYARYHREKKVKEEEKIYETVVYKSAGVSKSRPSRRTTRKLTDFDHAINELYDTEQGYCKSLANFKSAFSDRLSPFITDQVALPVLLKEFSLLESIHLDLSSHLEDAVSNIRREIDGGATIGSTFLKYAEKFTIYAVICAYQRQATEEIAQLKNAGARAPFTTALREAQDTYKRLAENPNCICDISSLVVVPFQRLSKYPLLLDAIIKGATKADVVFRDREEVEKARTKIKLVTDFVNEYVGGFNDQEFLAQLKGNIHYYTLPPDADFSRDYGSLRKDGALSIGIFCRGRNGYVKKKYKKEYHVHVLLKVTFVTKPCGGDKGYDCRPGGVLVNEMYRLVEPNRLPSDVSRSFTGSISGSAPAPAFALELNPGNGVRLFNEDISEKDMIVFIAGNEADGAKWLDEMISLYESLFPAHARSKGHDFKLKTMEFTLPDNIPRCFYCDGLLPGLTFQAYCCTCANCTRKAPTLHKECIRECIADNMKPFRPQRPLPLPDRHINTIASGGTLVDSGGTLGGGESSGGSMGGFLRIYTIPKNDVQHWFKGRAAGTFLLRFSTHTTATGSRISQDSGVLEEMGNEASGRSRKICIRLALKCADRRTRHIEIFVDPDQKLTLDLDSPPDQHFVSPFELIGYYQDHSLGEVFDQILIPLSEAYRHDSREEEDAISVKVYGYAMVMQPYSGRKHGHLPLSVGERIFLRKPPSSSSAIWAGFKAYDVNQVGKFPAHNVSDITNE